MLRTLLLLAACTSDPKTETPSCPEAWAWDGADCQPLLPETDGVDPVGAPERLSEGDFDTDTLIALAERFQPAQVFAGPKLWPVTVDFCYESGADLYQHPIDDAEHTNGVVVVEAAALPEADLSALPADGYVYGVDCAGDNTGPGADEATWFDAWDGIQGDDPAKAAFPPIHYVHPFWFDRDQELLALQYWFWYPHNKFANNHEGDWEHVNAILDVSSEAPALMDTHYYFHSGSLRAFQRLTRITDEAGGDHPVVFSGGCGGFAGWEGCYSGASYPWPGVYVGTAEFIEEDTTSQARFLHPDDIGVLIMPEPEDVSPGGDPRLSWIPLYMFHGQWEVEQNHAVILYAEANEVPTPAPYQSSWMEGVDVEDWPAEDEAASTFTFFEPPEGWEVLYNPGHDDTVRPE